MNLLLPAVNQFAQLGNRGHPESITDNEIGGGWKGIQIPWHRLYSRTWPNKTTTFSVHDNSHELQVRVQKTTTLDSTGQEHCISQWGTADFTAKRARVLFPGIGGVRRLQNERCDRKRDGTIRQERGKTMHLLVHVRACPWLVHCFVTGATGSVSTRLVRVF